MIHCYHNAKLECYCFDIRDDHDTLRNCPNKDPDFDDITKLLQTLGRVYLDEIDDLSDAHLALLIKAPEVLTEINCWWLAYEIAEVSKTIAKHIKEGRASEKLKLFKKKKPTRSIRQVDPI